MFCMKTVFFLSVLSLVFLLVLACSSQNQEVSSGSDQQASDSSGSSSETSGQSNQSPSSVEEESGESTDVMENTSPLPGPESESSSGSSETSSSSKKAFTIDVSSYAFSPSTLAVKKGDIVTLTLKGVSGNHGFALPDFGVSESVQKGDTITVTFVADKSGTFSYFCNVPCGSGHTQMRGTLNVQ